MNKKLSWSNYFFIGSMLFGLFFGAGNLMFPIYMGQESGASFLLAGLGFIITATGLPFLGVIAMGVSGKENLFSFAGLVSKKWAYFFTVLLYLTIGPFFALPRTATFSFEAGISAFIPGEYRSPALFVFSLIFFLLALYLAFYPGKILLWVGKILNPLFLLTLFILLFCAFVFPMSQVKDVPVSEMYAENAFFKGFREGYNTMDALASLAFGIIVIDVIRGFGIKEEAGIIKSIIKSGAISLILMVMLYLSLTFMGAQSAGLFGITPNRGEALSFITGHYFGGFGNVMLALVVFLACIKTAIGLINSCSHIFVEMFPKTLSYRKYAILFTILSIAIANIGLNRIIEFSVPVLMFAYPVTIVSIFLGLFTKKFKDEKLVWQSTIGVTAFIGFGDFLKSLPAFLSGAGWIQWISGCYNALPLSDIGMSWLLPAVLTTFVSIGITRIKKR